MRNNFFVAGTLILCLLAIPSRAATLTVTSTADDGGSGTLRSMLAGAQAGDTITFATNLSGAGIVLTNGGGLILSRSVTIDATMLQGGIRLNGNGQYTVLTVNSRVTAMLKALTITNGSGNSSRISGGGIFNDGGIVTLSSNTVTGNNGGGIENYNYGIMTVNASMVSGNTGCGIVNAGTITVNDCLLSGNRSGIDGVCGGIYNAGLLIVNTSTLSGNSGGGGGGIVNDGTLIVNSSTLSGNRGYRNSSCSSSGGGIFNGSGTSTVNSSTLSGNSDDSDSGGGIYIHGGTVTLAASTLSGNSNGGIYNNGTLKLTNSIVAGNSGNNSQDIYNKSVLIYGGANLVQSVSNTGTTKGSPSSTAAPNLAPLGNYGGPTATMLPLPGSPAINGGNYAANRFTTDQRGQPRTFGSHVDLGAVEMPPGVVMVISSADDGGSGTLRSLLAGANSGDVITFAPYLSGQRIVLANGGGLMLSRNVTIDATMLPKGIQIDGNGRCTVLTVNALNNHVTAVLNGLTITNGYGYVGGGIYNADGTLTLNACTLSGNTARPDTSDEGEGGGGGIYNGLGTLTLNACTLSGNIGLVDELGSGGGGGILNRSGRLTVNTSTLSDNTSGAGSGILNDSGATLTVNASTLSNNTGGGGGILNSGEGTLTVINESTLSGNEGSGIYNVFGTVTVNASTLSGNTSGIGGGGIFNGDTLNLTNSIVAGNSASSGPDIYNNDGSTLNYGGSNLVQFVLNNGKTTGSPSSTAAPNLASPGNYGGPTATMPPLPGSPAINGGSYAANRFAADQRGLPRTFGTYVDLGAVEFQQSPSAQTLAAGNVMATNAILNGLIVPADLTNQVMYTWYFAYGTTENYGSHSVTNTGTVSIATNVSQLINGLQPGVLYHYELFAQPNNGTGLTGGDQTLTTPVTKN